MGFDKNFNTHDVDHSNRHKPYVNT